VNKEYLMPYKCSNCYYTCCVWIPRGIEAPNWFECPRCGLNELRKTSHEFDRSLVTHYDMQDHVTLVER
jgi:DNA-directed RNA polymerase subunit RPC12/RpoP